MDPLLSSVDEWISYDPNPKSKQFVADLKAQGNVKELTKLFRPRIAFGTAGLRAAMQPGYHNINELVIIQTTQGLCDYLSQTNKMFQQEGVVIGYDGRHNSKTFADYAAAVLLDKGVKVYLFNKLVCTPMVPFGVVALKAAAGIMVTASHNPKDDNGYKVYWGNGAQIIPPVDEGIAKCIGENMKPWREDYLTFLSSIRQEEKNDMLVDKTDALSDLYFQTIRDTICYCPELNKTAPLRVTYTAMHGVGAEWVTKAFAAFDLPAYIPTKEQVEPDPEFPTVAFPNPEEGRGALALAIKAAEEAQSTLILANDPDADRLAVAAKDPSNGEWKILTGNEIAALLADWALLQWRNTHPNEAASNCVMVASTVSSKHLAAMGKAEGFEFRDVLTGFKWIGNEVIKAQKEGKTPLFAFEVEIGFLVGTCSYDKDGVRTAAVFYEMANYYATQHKMTLLDKVREFYSKYGHFKMINSYFFCPEMSMLNTIFGRLRNFDGKGGYPTTAGDFKIQSIRDVTTGFDSAKPSNKSTLPTMPNDHMLTFTFENGGTATMRNSGTEPKLKFYIEYASMASPEEAERVLEAMEKAIVEDFIEPRKYDLVRKKD